MLDYINPAGLNYQEWLNVGMALHYEGIPADVWEQWSRRDGKRYHSGECSRKWEGFHGSPSPVTGATIVQLAKKGGWQPDFSSRGTELDWNDTIEKDDLVVIDKDWIEGKEFKIPEKWEPVKQLITYLETLFESTDKVGYTTRATKGDGGRIAPAKGCWDRTAGQLIEKLSACGGDIGAVLGDYNPEYGAWIRFNPLDGQGIGNANVTDFRFALVESDNVDLEKQNAIIRELELPVAALVYSGGKSLHAIVRIEAADAKQYRERVEYLYKVCDKNGFEVDRNNKNPSRLSRMPGVIRSGKKQYLLDTNIGKKSWSDWVEWIESVNDDLPDPENLADIWDDMPELSPPLIDGILRQGHKMLIAGPSKAGKSYALLELCCAIAEGKGWLGFNCAQGKVMYVNLELDRASCLHRLKDVYTRLGWKPENARNIDMWHLRGKSVPMDKLAPKLIRRAAKKNYIAIIIDPIYKVITGDENDAASMAAFCNFFDRIAFGTGAAVAYCHHHSKGEQGAKKAQDRASGSGVFARDPDALIDMIALPLDEGRRKATRDRLACNALAAQLDRERPGWRSASFGDDLLTPDGFVEHMKEVIPDIRDRMDRKLKEAEATTAWRIDGILREFPGFQPKDVWFRWPCHEPDETGMLKDMLTEGEESASWRKKKGPTKKDQLDAMAAEFSLAYDTLATHGDVTTGAIADFLKVSAKEVYIMARKLKDIYVINNSIIKPKDRK